MTLLEKLEAIEKQVLDGKRALSYALQYVGITAVEPNDNKPDSYETFQSYADKIKRLQLANSMIFEYNIPTGNLTKYKRTIVLPIYGLSLNTIAKTIISSDTEYTPTNSIQTLELKDADYNNEIPHNINPYINDVWGNEIMDGNYTITIDELQQYLNDEETIEMVNAMKSLGISVTNDISSLADSEATYAFTVDWGDGTTAEYTTTASTDAIYHTYANGGTYDVSISGNFRRIYNGPDNNGVVVENGANYLDKDGTTIPNNGNYAGCNYLIKVIAWGNTRLTNMASAFYRCKKLSSIPMYDTTNSFVDVTDCSDIFRETALQEIPYDSNVERGLFSGCENVTSFARAFYSCSSLSGSIPVKFIDGCPKVTSTTGMFAYCSKITGSIPVGMLDGMTSLTNPSEMFASCNLDGELSADLFKNNPNVTTIYRIFYNCQKITGIIKVGFISNLTKLTDMRQAFYNCKGITGFESGAFANITSNSINCRDAFYNSGIQEIPEGLIESMTGTNNWFERMFSNCTSLTTIPSTIFSKMSNIGNARGMFQLCTNLTSATPDAPISGDWDSIEGMEKWYGVFAGSNNMSDYNTMILELGGNGNRKFSGYNVGSIVLSDKTFVDPINYTYDANNKPIGICYYDNGTKKYCTALADITRTWTRTQAECVDTPIPNISDVNVAYNGTRYEGENYTEIMRNWSGYTNDKDVYPAWKYIDEYSAGNAVAGDWFFPDATDLWDLFCMRGLTKNACDKIIASGGFTTSTCYPLRDGTWYWASAESSATNSWRVPTGFGGVDSWGYKWNSGYVRASLAF